MSNQYFDNFDKIVYEGHLVRDIIRRVKIVEELEENPYMFLPYTIQNDERAEDIAYDYYGDPHLIWLVYLANSVIDPDADWIMDPQKFRQYMSMKYGKGMTQTEAIQWANNTIKFYIKDDQTRITPETYQISPHIDITEWSPVTVLAYEEWLNESKRNIRLVNAELKDHAVDAFRKAMNG